MAGPLNSNFFFPGMNPVFTPSGVPAGLPEALPQAGNQNSRAGQQAFLCNESLGDHWQGMAQGREQNPVLNQFQSLYGEDSNKKTEGPQEGKTEGPQDEETRELLKKRTDITPKDVQEMKSELRSAFKEPAMQDAAYKKAMQALGDGGSSAKPQEMGKLLSQMSSAAGPKGASAALDMFDTGRELMKSGKTPQDVAGLAEGAQAVAGGEGSSPNNVAQMFNTAAKAVQSRPDMKPSEIKDMAQVVGQRFPGKDPTERMAAFEQGTQLMGQSTSMNAKGIDTMLARGQEQGLKGPKLLKSFESQGQAMRAGSLNSSTLQDKSSKGLNFDKQGSLKAPERASSSTAKGPGPGQQPACRS